LSFGSSSAFSFQAKTFVPQILTFDASVLAQGLSSFFHRISSGKRALGYRKWW
tara:strand:+ start:242 stop:400 length:159 start_codon:yes stop_codon:yes gene_type:complete